jgi:pimeloyl-ACP methyl ester carboxylesterase
VNAAGELVAGQSLASRRLNVVRRLARVSFVANIAAVELSGLSSSNYSRQHRASGLCPSNDLGGSLRSVHSILNAGDDAISVRHSSIGQGRPTVLFVHGLGDSSLAFDEAFHRSDCGDFNLVAPDLPGHGASPAARDGLYTLEALASRLAALIEAMDLRQLTVVGHSLGGDVAAVLASSDRSGRIDRIVSVEGTLTPADMFICNRATEAAEAGFEAFETWFHQQFRHETVFEKWALEGDAGRRYYASLRFCDPEAFLACAAELVLRNRAEDTRGLSGVGALYANLPVQKCFIYGTRSLPAKTVNLVSELKLRHHALPAGHWVMIDAASEFYPLLQRLALT